MSAATKNPDPRLDPASIVTTAGETRLTRSSSVVDSGAIGVDGSVDSAASAVVGGTGAIGALRTGGGWGAIVGDGCPAGVFGAGVDIVVGAADDGADPRMNHQPPPSTMAMTAAVRPNAAALLSGAVEGSSALSDVVACTCVNPQRQVVTFGGTRR